MADSAFESRAEIDTLSIRSIDLSFERLDVAFDLLSKLLRFVPNLNSNVYQAIA